MNANLRSEFLWPSEEQELEMERLGYHWELLAMRDRGNDGVCYRAMLFGHSRVNAVSRYISSHELGHCVVAGTIVRRMIYVMWQELLAEVQKKAEP